MGGRIGGGDDDVISDINITPFVDIILVVLIIFMVTATQIVESAIKLNLPEAASGEPTEDISLGLMLTADGGLFLDGSPVDAEGLKAAVRTAKSTVKSTPDGKDDVVVLIAADELVAHGRIIWLLDLLRGEGVAKYALNIDKAKAIPPDPASVGKGTGG